MYYKYNKEEHIQYKGREEYNMDSYTKACTEVTEMLAHLPESQYNLIPKEEIMYYKKNSDKSYNFILDPTIPLQEQKISKQANAIIISLFYKYFLNSKMQEQLEEVLKENEKIMEEEKRQKYNPDDLFKDRKYAETVKIANDETKEMTCYKDKWITRWLNKIRNFFWRNKR